MIDEQPLRIWIDDHNPIFRLGLGACLEPPFLLAGESARFSPQPDLIRTDIVVLDLDDEGALGTAAEITSEFPAIKVIACSCEEPVMRVFPPFHHGESYASKLSAALLALALSS